MRKTLLRVTVGAAAAAASIMGSGVAQAAGPETVPNDQYPTTHAMLEQWNDGGGHLGYGAASLISAAWVGVPTWAIANTLGTASGDVEFVPADGN